MERKKGFLKKIEINAITKNLCMRRDGLRVSVMLVCAGFIWKIIILGRQKISNKSKFFISELQIKIKGKNPSQNIKESFDSQNKPYINESNQRL